MKARNAIAAMASAIMMVVSLTISAAAADYTGDPNVYFADAVLEIYDWETPAGEIQMSSMIDGIWLWDHINGKLLGGIVEGRVNPEGAGYPNYDNGQGLLDAFNDYRGVQWVPKTNYNPYDETEPYVIKPAPVYDANAREVIGLVNIERRKAGVAEVEIDEDIMALAMVRAQELETLYSHTRPSGSSVSKEYPYTGECIVGANSAERAVDAWMNSEVHRRSLLKDWNATVGVGCHKGADGVTYWVILFGL